MSRGASNPRKTQLAVKKVASVSGRVMLSLFERDDFDDFMRSVKISPFIFTTFGLMLRTSFVPSTNPIFETQSFGGFFRMKLSTVSTNSPVSSMCRKLWKSMITQRAGPSSLAFRQKRRSRKWFSSVLLIKDISRHIRMARLNMESLGLHHTTL